MSVIAQLVMKEIAVKGRKTNALLIRVSIVHSVQMVWLRIHALAQKDILVRFGTVLCCVKNCILV